MKSGMAKKALAAGMAVLLSGGMLTVPATGLAAPPDGEDCFVQASEARGPRPSGGWTSDGKYFEYDYSKTPDPAKSALICVDNGLLDPNAPAEAAGGTTLVPLKALVLALGGTYKYDSKTKSGTAKWNGRTIRVQENGSYATVDGRSVKMEASARIKWGNVYLPLGFAAKQFDFRFYWQKGSNLLKIVTPPELAVKAVESTTAQDTSDYRYGNFFGAADRYLLENDQTIHLLESHGDKLVVQQFSADLVKTKETRIDFELTQFGGAHAGADGNFYLVFGQPNSEESAGKTVYRVVKYDNRWKRLASLDIKDVYVTLPFNAGNLSMDSRDGKLAVYTSRQRYLTPDDGLRHQSNIQFLIDAKTMSLLESGGQWPKNHVSHSFANYVKFDGDRIVYANHGDAYPRSMVLQTEQDGSMRQNIEFMHFPGKIGDNYTGVRLGGLEIAAGSYVMAGSSVSLTEQYGKNKTQNLYAAVIPKNAEEDGDATIVWLTNHPANSGVSIEETHLSKINDDKFALLWTESANGKTTLRYAVIDGKGKLLKKPTALEGLASPGNLTPLVRGDSLLWYSFNSVYQRGKKLDGIEFYTLRV